MGRSVQGSTARADTKSKHLVDKYSRTCRARPFLDRKGERTVVSERKLEANRRNAKRSTGPRIHGVLGSTPRSMGCCRRRLLSRMAPPKQISANRILSGRRFVRTPRAL